jgi:pyruvate/2-oxoglutarate dehydrogenase complex dihydrolipoamide acyltransferase (E2) component
MMLEVIMPKQGMYEGDVTLIRWLIPDGTDVLVGDVLFTMENEKVEIDIEAEDAGILVQSQDDGFVAAVGTVIGYLVTTRAEYDQIKANK